MSTSEKRSDQIRSRYEDTAWTIFIKERRLSSYLEFGPDAGGQIQLGNGNQPFIYRVGRKQSQDTGNFNNDDIEETCPESRPIDDQHDSRTVGSDKSRSNVDLYEATSHHPYAVISDGLDDLAPNLNSLGEAGSSQNTRIVASTQVEDPEPLQNQVDNGQIPHRSEAIANKSSTITNDWEPHLDLDGVVAGDTALSTASSRVFPRDRQHNRPTSKLCHIL